MSDTVRIAFIGGGQMSRALLGGLRRQGWPAAALAVSDPDPAARDALRQDWPGVEVAAGNAAVAGAADAWILAVKPQALPAVARELAPVADRRQPLVISLAAGVRSDTLRGWLGPAARVVRCMPNRPALVGAGITGLHAGAGVGAGDRTRAEALLGAVGECLWFDDEAALDAVTAVSGSGPAYVFLLLELLEAAARREGLDGEAAGRLARATVAGAARMAAETGAPAAELRASVTSPGGTTAAALALLDAGWQQQFLDAVRAARRRAAELSAPEACR